MIPPVLPNPMLNKLACSVLVPVPSVRVDVFESLRRFVSPTVILAALMKLVGVPALAKVSMPRLFAPKPTLKLPVVLTFTLVSADMLTVVVSFALPLLLLAWPIFMSALRH